MINWLKKIFSSSSPVIQAVVPRKIVVVSATYINNILTVKYSDGSSFEYEGSCTVWHTYPMFNKCGTLKDGELYQIWKYIKHHGNPYQNAHILNKINETSKKFNI